MIRRMRPADIPAAMLLKQAAGWNQTEQDWANVLALEPEGCWVYEAEGSERAKQIVAGSTTAICYGQELAWIGMVLVSPEFRGRGYARALMEHALRFLAERRVRVVRLDATDMGRSLYAKLGFRDECAIERWAAPAVPIVRQQSSICTAICTAPLRSLTELAALDRQAFGAGRTQVIARLAECFPAESLRAEKGFAMARPGSGAHFLGPCVAEDGETARGLIETLLAGHAGQNAFWDLLPENGEAVRLAREMGFECRRRLVRMVLGESEHIETTRGNAALQFATAGFEYG
jgi:ribosomal protein S18 acetylase RimI-like enzyme